MPKVKKSNEGSGPENLDILAAKVKVLDAEYYDEPYTVNLDSGRSFDSDPNVNLRLQVERNLVEPGKDEGATFFDRFRLKQDKDGDWIFSRYSKLGNLMIVLYGEEWFDDPDAEFSELDLIGFGFVCQIEPKTDKQGKVIPGSTINWKSMRPAGGADEREAKEEVKAAVADSEGDFEDLPF